jgi:MoxR-like ATPase
MKSAVELAMQKLNKRQQEEPSAPLTEAQRREISELRQQYDAKIAEKDIMMQSEIRQLVQRRPPQEAVAVVRELQENFQQTKKALQQELETKIAAVRTGA